MAAEDEQGGSSTPTPRDDNRDDDSSIATPARPARPAVVTTNTPPARPAVVTTNSNNNSSVTPSATSTVVSGSTRASLSFTAASDGAAGAASDGAVGAANSCDSFLAAAAAEARQQGSSASSSTASNAAGNSTQKMQDELTASSVAAVRSKLEQVRGYIHQTSTAMEGLEQLADLSKIGQYNTLVKVLRELKSSEAKLATHLATLLAAGVTGRASSPAAAATDGDGRAAVPNSQSIGLVSSRIVHNVDNTGAPPSPSAAPSFSDRLTAGMEEANQITGRLRENVARREDLVERYRATRERLTALKRQRRDIQQQERSILLAHSSRESPYEDPIPGASSWNLDELNTGLDDFRALYDKVATLRTAYTSKTQALEEGDAAGRAEIDSKMQQLETKRAQLIAVITQLKRLRANRLREQGMDADVDPEDLNTAGSSSLAATDAAATGVSQSFVDDGAAGGSSTTSSADGVAAAKPELQHRLSASLDAMLETETSVTDAVSRGGSVSIGTLPSLVSAADISGGTGTPNGGVEGGVTEDPMAAVVVARAEMEAAGRELSVRTQHLNNLREELAGMKRLLDTTQRRVTDEDDDDDGEETAGPSAPTAAVGERAGQFITGVNGNIIRLSDLERQNPVVIEKYKQLREAKQRMAQMEQVMQAISSSRGSGLPLNEVLSPEQLSLLEEAEAEEDPSGSARLRRSRSARGSGERDSGDRDSDEGSLDRDFFSDTPQRQAASSELPPSRLLTNQAPPQPSLPSLPPNNTAASGGDRNDSHTLISSSAAHRRQNQIATEALTSAMKNKRSNFCAVSAISAISGEVAEVQQRLSKPSNAAPRWPVNEETGRLKRQERWGNEDFNNEQPLRRPNNSQRGEDASSARSRSSSCNERTSVPAGGRGVAGDPRVAAIAMLQEELRQKKNALEALMRGMGKPSSLHPDNISDNISDGESGTLTPTPTRPARGRRGNRDHSVDFTEEYRGRGARPQSSGPPQHLADGAPARGLSRHQQRLHTPSGAVMSFNNLSADGEGGGGESSRSVRPKQNSRSTMSRLPDGESNRRNLLGDGTNTQQTISEALQQLSTVQGSINSLYDTLRTERDARSTTPSVANNRQQMALQQQEMKYQQQLQQQQQQQQQQVLNNMFALAAPAQPPSLPPGGVSAADAAMQPPGAPLVSGLQQCFSQLYLHSLEIQALNKHIQVRHQQQMLQLQHLHQQQQLQQVQQQQQQQQQIIGATSLLPSVYYNAPSLPFMSLQSSMSPFAAGVAPGVIPAGVIPNAGIGFGGSFGLPNAAVAASAMGLGVPGVAPQPSVATFPTLPNLQPSVATFPTFPNFPPF